MKFAPVSNVASLEYLPRTSYHLVLSNQLAKHPTMMKYYQKRIRKGDVVILDHPVHERLPLPPTEVILALLDELRPTYAIVPDVIGDPKATLAQFEDIAQGFRNYGTRPIGVVQGRNWKEYINSFADMVKLTDFIGLPLVRKYDPVDRAELISALTSRGLFIDRPQVKIHLLGSDNTFSDVRRLRHHPNVMGFDTAKAVYMGVQGIRIIYARKIDWGRPDNFFDLPESYSFHNASVIEDNVNYLSEIVAGSHDAIQAVY